MKICIRQEDPIIIQYKDKCTCAYILEDKKLEQILFDPRCDGHKEIELI